MRLLLWKTKAGPYISADSATREPSAVRTTGRGALGVGPPPGRITESRLRDRRLSPRDTEDRNRCLARDRRPGRTGRLPTLTRRPLAERPLHSKDRGPGRPTHRSAGRACRKTWMIVWNTIARNTEMISRLRPLRPLLPLPPPNRTKRERERRTRQAGTRDHGSHLGGTTRGIAETLFTN